MMQTSTGTLVYFLLSKDDYDIDQILFFLKKKLMRESEEILTEIYHRDDTDLSIILDSALNLPMFARNKLVVIKYASEPLTSDIPFLLEYLRHPSPRTILLITAKEWHKKGEMVDRFQKCFRKVPAVRIGTADGKALWITFPGKIKKEEKVPSWIQQQCSEKGLRMEEDAIDLFYEICGKDKLTMRAEIEKFASFKVDQKNITIKDIKKIAAENKVFDVYALLGFICQKEYAKAVEVLRELLESRKGHPFIIWHLDNFFSKLALVKMALRRGVSDNAATEKADVKFYKDQYIQNAKSVHNEVIMKAPDCIFNADRLIKSGCREEIILEKLIFDLTR